MLFATNNDCILLYIPMRRELRNPTLLFQFICGSRRLGIVNVDRNLIECPSGFRRLTSIGSWRARAVWPRNLSTKRFSCDIIRNNFFTVLIVSLISAPPRSPTSLLPNTPAPRLVYGCLGKEGDFRPHCRVGAVVWL